MFNELAPYPEYGHNQTWEGLAPLHWKHATMRAVARERTVSGVPGEPLLSVSIKHGVTTQAELLSESSKRDGSNLDRSAYKLVEPGDIAYNKMRAWQGAAGMSRFRGIVSPAYVVLRPNIRIAQPLYLHHLLRLPEYASEAARWSYGITSDQWSLRPEHFRRIPVSIPPLDEQEAIVTYLAHAHQRISQAIASKRRMIDLLAEERRVVARTVLQSVGGQAVALKHLLRALIDCEHKTAPFWELGSKRIVRTAGVRNGSLVLAGTYPTTDEAYDVWTRRGVPKPGDVIFTREAPAGEACVVPPDLELALGQRTVLMKPRLDRLDPAFLVHQIYSGASRQVIEIASQGSTVGHFNMSDIAALPIPLVDVSRQKELVHSIERESARLDLLSETFHREIRLLEEFRTRLTADVVTGQLDVRAVAVTLPKIDPAVVSETSNGSACEDDQEALDSDEQGEA